MNKKIAAIQMTSTMNVDENLETVKNLLKEAEKSEIGLVVLPEMFALQKTALDNVKMAEPFGQGKIQEFLSQQAKENKLWIVGGTIPIRTNKPDKMRAACLVFDNHGECVGRYDKIHLFDARVSETEIYYESKTTAPGSDLTVLDTPFGRLGLAVCFDVRFSEMFHQMMKQGAEIFAIPSAFAVKTGQAHFEILMRARAIENFSYVIASCQTGNHPNGRHTYGHSVVVSPWGEVLQLLEMGEGIIANRVNLEGLHRMRQDIFGL